MKELLEKYENKQPEIVFEWKDSETEAEGWVVINSLRGGAAGGGHKDESWIRQTRSNLSSKNHGDKIHGFRPRQLAERNQELISIQKILEKKEF